MKMRCLNCTLDKQQTKAVLTNNVNTIICAGAGAGKSLTMVAKIKYLVLNKQVNLEDILCVTFTNNAALSLETKIKQELKKEYKVYTFHKLALSILQKNGIHKNILANDYLEFITNEILYSIEKKLLQDIFHSPNFQKIIIRFIKIYMANYYDEEWLNIIIKKASSKDKFKLLLIKKIYQIYLLEQEAQNCIDFEQMIYLATKIINQGGYVTSYKFIIIDEYQDTSNLREKLIIAIKQKTQALVMVVGDDFQSIYRFSGCNVNNFWDFKKHFKPAKMLFLTKTYRNSQELINVAGNFIMRNKKQMPKKLKSVKKIFKPIIVAYYNNAKRDFWSLIDIINYQNILILGRNNSDILKLNTTKLFFTNNKLLYKNKNVYFKTIHKAKGLEEDAVVIINLVDNINSLPCKLVDDNINRYIIKYANTYPYEEERRLFYVALTRTKNYCYLFVNKKNPSIFVREILKDYKNYIRIINL